MNRPMRSILTVLLIVAACVGGCNCKRGQRIGALKALPIEKVKQDMVGKNLIWKKKKWVLEENHISKAVKRDVNARFTSDLGQITATTTLQLGEDTITGPVELTYYVNLEGKTAKITLQEVDFGPLLIVQYLKRIDGKEVEKILSRGLRDNSELVSAQVDRSKLTDGKPIITGLTTTRLDGDTHQRNFQLIYVADFKRETLIHQKTEIDPIPVQWWLERRGPIEIREDLKQHLPSGTSLSSMKKYKIHSLKGSRTGRVEGTCLVYVKGKQREKYTFRLRYTSRSTGGVRLTGGKVEPVNPVVGEDESHRKK